MSGLVVPSNDLEGSTSSTITNAASSVSNTLSRNELYTPLIAFQQDKVEPSLYMTTARRKVPKSLHESSLIKFLENISTHYHRSSQVQVKDARNNASRPLLAHEMGERLRLRAVTLVGDGMFAGKRNNERKRQSSQQQQQLLSDVTVPKGSRISNQKRKKQIRLARAKQHASTQQVATTTLSKPAADAKPPPSETGNEVDPCNHHDLSFLQKLNVMWNDYMGQLVKAYHKNHTDEDLFQRVSSVIGMGAELVGAKVRVIQCPGQRHLVGAEGYIVAVTTNTWKISTTAVMRPKLSKPTKDDAAASTAEAPMEVDIPVQQKQKVVVVPKRGAILTIRLPIQILRPELMAEDSEDATTYLCVDIKG